MHNRQAVIVVVERTTTRAYHKRDELERSIHGPKDAASTGQSARHAAGRGGPSSTARELRAVPSAPATRAGLLGGQGQQRPLHRADVLRRGGQLRRRQRGGV